jgi:hypothetical protein
MFSRNIGYSESVGPVGTIQVAVRYQLIARLNCYLNFLSGGFEWSKTIFSQPSPSDDILGYRRLSKARKEADAGRVDSQTKFVKKTGGGAGQAVLKVTFFPVKNFPLYTTIDFFSVLIFRAEHFTSKKVQ